jgi:propanol-preferring alcohol dehydrogenase
MKALPIGYARVRIRANGVCSTDVKLVDGRGFTPNLPFTPGHEPSGTVEEVNSLNDSDGQYNGKNFVIFPHITCGQCENCINGKENLCLNSGGSIGLSVDGAMAKYVDVPIKNLIPMPNGLDFVNASLAGGVVAVPLTAIKEQGNIMNKNTLVIGTGGLAMAAVQILKNSGADVTVLGRKDEKLEVAKKIGADRTLNSTVDLWENELRQISGNGMDYIIDLAGDPNEIPRMLKYVKRGGSISIVGYSKEILSLDYSKIALDGIKIVGSRSYTRNDLRYAIAMISKKKVVPVIQKTLPLELANDAISLVRDGKSIGRIVLTI